VNSAADELLAATCWFTRSPAIGVPRKRRGCSQGCNISVQGVNEFANVARLELGMTWAELRKALAAIRTLCRTSLPIDIDTHSRPCGRGALRVRDVRCARGCRCTSRRLPRPVIRGYAGWPHHRRASAHCQPISLTPLSQRVHRTW
jgi:hypothetical protein